MNVEYFPRNSYLEEIKPYLEKKIIKVIIGMRRSGKSYFLRQLRDLYREKGVHDQNILLVDMEEFENDDIRDYKDFAKRVNDYFEGVQGKKILFVDEVQEIDSWERAIRSYGSKNEFDVFVTGSNAQILSSEIATLLSGRTIEMRMYPLSFREFLDFNKIKDKQGGLKEYLMYGGMPVIYDLNLETERKRFELLRSLYNTIIFKDVVTRYQIRNVRILERLVHYVFDNIGNTFSAKKIADYLKSQRQPVSIDTILNYLSYLESALIIHKAERFDIKGKRILEVQEKYFVSDLGIRHAILGYRENDIGAILENVVYLELKRQGFNVYIGKLDNKEVDFIAELGGRKIYVQVTFSLNAQEFVDREFGPLIQINDNFPKYVVSLDEIFSTDIKGIQWLNLKDFLLKDLDL